MAEDIVLSDLQLDLMRVLWRAGELNVADATAAPPSAPVAAPPVPPVPPAPTTTV